MRCAPRLDPVSLHRGFTLVELAIVLAIAAVLVSQALPTFAEPIERAKRLEATAALQRASLAQERWRDRHAAFTSDVGPLGLRLAPINGATSFLTPSGRWRIDVQLASSAAHGYVITASSVGPQADRNCQQLRLVAAHGQMVHEATPASQRDRCWGF
jgi:type IV pilus assembly protein PilE